MGCKITKTTDKDSYNPQGGSGISSTISSSPSSFSNIKDNNQTTSSSFVYSKDNYGGGWVTIEYQFKPQYGKPEFMGVGFGPAKGVDGWGKHPKVKVTSKMKKEMIKTLQDKNSEEVDVLKRNSLRLSNVLSWVKRL